MEKEIRYLIEHGISRGMLKHMSDPEIKDLFINVFEIWNGDLD